MRLSPHERFNFFNFDRHITGHQLTALGRDHGVVFNANANVVEALGNAWGRANIDAWLDG